MKCILNQIMNHWFNDSMTMSWLTSEIVFQYTVEYNVMSAFMIPAQNMTGANISLKWFTKKKEVVMRPTRKPNPRNMLLTPPSDISIAFVPRMFVNFSCDRSPCIHVLMVSNGCVKNPAVKALQSDDAARAIFLSRPMEVSNSRFKTGVSPNMAIVKRLSRPQVVIRPRTKIETPCFCTRLAGVPINEPPVFCCWIMHNSHREHGTPETSPPSKAAEISSLLVRAPGVPSVCWKKPVAPNWTAVVPPRFRQAIGSPR